MKYLDLDDISAYKKAFRLSNYVWKIVIEWDLFSRNTIGTQFVRAVDSISANLAEGFGRYSKKDKIKFYYYSFGSLKESLDWNEKSKYRDLITSEQYGYINNEIRSLPKEIHELIKYTNEKLKE